jgi:hypothetical protein
MKILINDTTSIHPAQAQNWIQWMQNIVIPLVKNESCIESFRLTKIKGGEDENGITYALQFICKDVADYQHFSQHFDPKLQEEQKNRFQGHFGSFRSVLEVLEEV